MNQDFKELSAIFLVILAIICGLQWLLLRFTHWSIALIASCFIALTISSVYVGYKNATPNGGSHGPAASEYIVPTIVVLGCLLFSLMLIYYLMNKEKGFPFHKNLFLIPAVLFAVFFVGRYLYNYIYYTSHFLKTLSECELQIINESHQKPIIDLISFTSESTDMRMDFELASNKEGVLYKEPKSFIPRDTDKITFQCDNGRNYDLIYQKFAFDYKLCEEKTIPKDGLESMFFWIESKKILPIKIVLLPDNKVKLYIDRRLVEGYALKALRPIEEESH